MTLQLSNNVIRDVLMRILSDDPLVALDVSALSQFMLRVGAAGADPKAPAQVGKVAVVPLYGALMPKAGWFGTSTQLFAAQVKARAADPDVSGIVLDIDSPGGSVAGTAEAAAVVRDAAAQKPVIAVSNTLAASAAYWIGSQASEFVMAPSADVGSIGAMIMHADVSDALAQMGVKVTLIRSQQSPYKNEAHPYAPLGDDASAFLQARADDAGAEFIKAVAAGRKSSQANVKEKYGQGRVYGAKEAVSRGMADRIATLDDVIGGMMQKRAAARRRSALAFE